jgi:hypothetical protein
MELYATGVVVEGQEEGKAESKPLMPLSAPTPDVKSHLLASGEPETAQLPAPR